MATNRKPEFFTNLQWLSFKSNLSLMRLGLVVLLASTLYVAVRTSIKSIPGTILHLPPDLILFLHSLDPWLFSATLIASASVYIRYALTRSRVIDRVYNEVAASKYPSESKKLEKSIKSIVDGLALNKHDFYEINDKQHKDVYAITGNWRSGKTTTAGQLLDLLRREESILWGGEYYHDTFNFGNINESIHSFFSNIALLTHIDEFNQLARTASPQQELSLRVGPITFPNLFVTEKNVRDVRKHIHDQLGNQAKTYIIILDDIDRLLPEEQIQWWRTIELMGKFNKNILLIVPVNYLEVSKALNKNSISEKYLEKILPNTINVGVDIAFIKKELDVGNNPSPVVARKYSKYLYCLALRMCLAKLNDTTISSRVSWEHDFVRGLISRTALTFKDGLYVPETSGAKFNLGPNSEYQVGGDKILLFNDGHQYSYNEVINIPYRYFLAASQDTNDIESVRVRTIEKLLDITVLNKIFERVRFKYIDRSVAASIRVYASIAAEEVDFWEVVGYSIVRDLESDPAISTYFTYDIISEELKTLKSIDSETDETQFFIEFTRNGKIAQ